MRARLAGLAGLGVGVALLAGCAANCVVGETDTGDGQCIKRCADRPLEQVALPAGLEGVTLNGVYGFRQGDALTVFVVGDKSTVLRWDGTGQEGQWAADPWKAAGAIHWAAVWGTGPEDLWVVGAGGSAAHRSETSWTMQNVNASNADLTAIWGSTAGEIWIGSKHGYLNNKSGDWRPALDIFIDKFCIITGLGEERWVVCGPADTSNINLSGGLQSGSWALQQKGLTRGVLRVADEAWIVGDSGKPLVLRRRQDGWPAAPSDWTPQDPGALFQGHAIAGRGERDVWMVGEQGAVLRLDTQAAAAQLFTRASAGTSATLNAVWVDDARCEVWIVGQNGTVLRRKSL